MRTVAKKVADMDKNTDSYIYMVVDRDIQNMNTDIDMDVGMVPERIVVLYLIFHFLSFLLVRLLLLCVWALFLNVICNLCFFVFLKLALSVVRDLVVNVYSCVYGILHK